MELMLVTLEVLKLERSREVREEAYLNMELMLVTLEVLKLERSREVREEAP
jgi:hypothetical protein